MTAADQPATPSQRAVIDLWRRQLGMTDVEIDDLARNHGSAMTVLTSKVAGAIITDLARMRHDQQTRRMS